MMHWWHSIRWRLALGSMLVALLATGLLALSALLAISYYYNANQQTQLTNYANDSTQLLGEHYGEITAHTRAHLVLAATQTFSRRITSTGTLKSPQGDEYLILVLNTNNQFVYPIYKSSATTALRSIVVTALRTAGTNGDFAVLHQAILTAHKGTPTLVQIGSNRTFSRLLMVEPVRDSGQATGQVIGVLVMAPTTAANDTIPPFLSAVWGAVLIASVVVAILAALAAIIFSRTITRPLSTLTSAARRMESGDLQTRVSLHTKGELGMLASSFNEMAEQLNRDVEELRKQELWRRELIMSITHDLATPLTAIAGLGESLIDGIAQSREDYEATGQIIVRETLRLRRLVKDLHVMAKVEAGALQPQRSDVRLAALVDEVFAALAPEFERADVEPRNTISYSLPTLSADADMLTRVFTNLCANAIRHTSPGGNVTIDAQLLGAQPVAGTHNLLASSVALAAHSSMNPSSNASHDTGTTPTQLPSTGQQHSPQQGNTLLISVTDTGEGIPPEALSLIFERFYRADNARQSATGGSGLGLAIVRAIIEAHDGHVWAENAPEGGARILFTLPLAGA